MILKAVQLLCYSLYKLTKPSPLPCNLRKWTSVMSSHEKPISSFGGVGANFAGSRQCQVAFLGGSPDLREGEVVGGWVGGKISSHNKFLPQKIPPTTNSSHKKFLPRLFPPTKTSSHPTFLSSPTIFSSHNWGERQIIFQQNRLPPIFSPQMRKRCSRQKDLLYTLGPEVPKLVYAFWTCN